MRTGLLPRAISVAVTGTLLCASLLDAQQQITATDGVYTAAQADRGRALYREQCATCHGEALQGISAPPLTGTVFLGAWGAQPLSDLASKIRNTMPADKPGKLQPAQTADLVAFILQTGKFPAGGKDLASDDAALKKIVLTGSQGAAQAASQGPAFPPLGNLNQLMRGMLFPTSNIIFNVQTNDPAAPPKAPAGDPTNKSFSWTDWGAGIYAGWQVVDYAAVAIADAAPLLLTPGRRCENGKPVPVTDPDWIKFTLRMAEAGRAAYRASQTRSQEAVSDATNELAESCFACHSVYRDKRGGRGAGAGAARCTH